MRLAGDYGAAEFRQDLLKVGVGVHVEKIALSRICRVANTFAKFDSFSADFAIGLTILRNGRFSSGNRNLLVIPPDRRTLESVLSLLLTLSSYTINSSVRRSIDVVAVDVSKVAASVLGKEWRPAVSRELSGPFVADPGTLFHIACRDRSHPPSVIYEPRVPRSIMGGEDAVTPRVCMCTRLDGCMTAGGVRPSRSSVYTNSDAVKYWKPSERLVPDVGETGEVWVLDRIRLARCEASKSLVDEAKKSKQHAAEMAKTDLQCRVRRNRA